MISNAVAIQTDNPVIFISVRDFLTHESGKFAIRQPIRIGRQNPQYYEVTEGLKPGDRVIVIVE